jgi:uncharacterized protein YqgC (DUF456 family)
MDIFWIIIGSLFMLAGIIGCFIPFLPGPPLSYIGFIALQFKGEAGFTSSFMWYWAVIVLVITLLDYVVPAYGTKKFGGSRLGILGCTVGLIFGIWMGPIGIIFGPFVGALIGELISNKNSNQAFRAAMGSFVGFLFGTLMKFITCMVMVWYFIKAI